MTLSNDLQALKQHLATLSQDDLQELYTYIEKRLTIPTTYSSPSALVGLISDIHGDEAGFEAALRIFEREGVSHILCAGDISERGAGADAIVEKIKAQGIICIAGNHDATVSEYQDVRLERTADDPDKAERLRRLGRIVDAETLAFLRDLPSTREVVISGVRIMLAHGTPWSDVLHIWPNTRQEIIERVLKQYNADVFVLGHTHMPMCLRIDKRYMVNPGSVYGVTTRDSHTCATLSLPDRTMRLFDLDNGGAVPLPIVAR